MAISYDPTCPTPRDRVRLLIGDTDTAAQSTHALDDGEITALLSMWPSLYAAAAAAADALAAKLARLPEGSAGPHVFRATSRASELRATAARLRAQAAASAGVVAGGIATTRVFEPGQFDHEAV